MPFRSTLYAMGALLALSLTAVFYSTTGLFRIESEVTGKKSPHLPRTTEPNGAHDEDVAEDRYEKKGTLLGWETQVAQLLHDLDEMENSKPPSDAIAIAEDTLSSGLGLPSLRRPLFFVHIPKSGGTTMRHALFSAAVRWNLPSFLPCHNATVATDYEAGAEGSAATTAGLLSRKRGARSPGGGKGRVTAEYIPCAPGCAPEVANLSRCLGSVWRAEWRRQAAASAIVGGHFSVHLPAALATAAASKEAAAPPALQPPPALPPPPALQPLPPVPSSSSLSLPPSWDYVVLLREPVRRFVSAYYHFVQADAARLAAMEPEEVRQAARPHPPKRQGTLAKEADVRGRAVQAYTASLLGVSLREAGATAPGAERLLNAVPVFANASLLARYLGGYARGRSAADAADAADAAAAVLAGGHVVVGLTELWADTLRWVVAPRWPFLAHALEKTRPKNVRDSRGGRVRTSAEEEAFEREARRKAHRVEARNAMRRRREARETAVVLLEHRGEGFKGGEAGRDSRLDGEGSRPRSRRKGARETEEGEAAAVAAAAVKVQEQITSFVPGGQAAGGSAGDHESRASPRRFLVSERSAGAGDEDEGQGGGEGAAAASEARPVPRARPRARRRRPAAAAAAAAAAVPAMEHEAAGALPGPLRAALIGRLGLDLDLFALGLRVYARQVVAATEQGAGQGAARQRRGVHNGNGNGEERDGRSSRVGTAAGLGARGSLDWTGGEGGGGGLGGALGRLRNFTLDFRETTIL